MDLLVEEIYHSAIATAHCTPNGDITSLTTNQIYITHSTKH